MGCDGSFFELSGLATLLKRAPMLPSKWTPELVASWTEAFDTTAEFVAVSLRDLFSALLSGYVSE